MSFPEDDGSYAQILPYQFRSSALLDDDYMQTSLVSTFASLFTQLNTHSFITQINSTLLNLTTNTEFNGVHLTQYEPMVEHLVNDKYLNSRVLKAKSPPQQCRQGFQSAATVLQTDNLDYYLFQPQAMHSLKQSIRIKGVCNMNTIEIYYKDIESISLINITPDSPEVKNNTKINSSIHIITKVNGSGTGLESGSVTPSELGRGFYYHCEFHQPVHTVIRLFEHILYLAAKLYAEHPELFGSSEIGHQINKLTIEELKKKYPKASKGITNTAYAYASPFITLAQPKLPFHAFLGKLYRS